MWIYMDTMDSFEKDLVPNAQYIFPIFQTETFIIHQNELCHLIRLPYPCNKLC